MGKFREKKLFHTLNITHFYLFTPVDIYHGRLVSVQAHTFKGFKHLLNVFSKHFSIFSVRVFTTANKR